MDVKNAPYSIEVGALCLFEIEGDLVELSTWREKFMAKYDSKNDGAKRKAFCIAKHKLIDMQIIKQERRWLMSIDRNKLDLFMCK